MYFCKEYNNSKEKSLYEDKAINSNKNDAVNTGISQSFDLFTKYVTCDKGKVMTHSQDEARSGELNSSLWAKGMKGFTPETQLSPRLSLFSSCAWSWNTKDFLAQQSGSGSSIHVAAEPQHGQTDLKELYPLLRAAGSTLQGKQSGIAQLTICYGGTVNVYDDIPADKAQAIMLLASGKPIQDNSNYISEPQWKKSDLPIARNHSLQRFLDKRKHRLNSKAPYTPEENPNRILCFKSSSISFPAQENLLNLEI